MYSKMKLLKYYCPFSKIIMLYFWAADHTAILRLEEALSFSTRFVPDSLDSLIPIAFTVRAATHIQPGLEVISKWAGLSQIILCGAVFLPA